MLKRMIKALTPPLAMDAARWVLGRKGRGSQTESGWTGDLLGAESKLEFIDFYGNTSLFALEVIQRHGALHEKRLLSLGNRMSHLADYVALFGTVYHSTWLKTFLPVPPNGSSGNLVVLEGDFFELNPTDIDCVISQASIHCLNDSRYGNEGTGSGWQRPYQAAAKLRQIIGDKSIPVVVSIAVHRNESLIDDNARLEHEKFVQSFLNAGFSLQEYFFDYLCYGMPQRTEYLGVQYRRARSLPTEEQAASEYNYVIGNYYFL
jgi:hypothetical protein